MIKAGLSLSTLNGVSVFIPKGSRIGYFVAVLANTEHGAFCAPV